MQNVSIAFCTYNGARFLGEQLASLARQTRLPDELIVCDDRSMDETVALLKVFAADAPFPVTIEINKERLGPAANFAKAAELCSGDVVLFCDQDDVWHDDKTALETEAVIEAERQAGAKVPVLVHGDLEVVDENLAPLHRSYMRLMHPKLNRFDMAYMLGDNVAVGCTTAVNRPLLEIALPLPEQALMHDWWFAQCATACGKIVYIDRPIMKYRQHESNQIGASPWLSRLSSALRTPKRQWESKLTSLRATIAQAEALEKRLAERSCRIAADRQTISDYAALLDGGNFTRIRHTFRHGYGRSGRLGILWFLTKAIFA